MRPSLIGIVREALLDAPPRSRRVMLVIVAAWAAMLAMQIWDVWDRSGPAVVAELLGVLTMLAGTLLLVPGWLLHAEASGQTRATPPAVVQALPVLAAAAATCYGFALAMLVTRALLGVEIRLVVILAVVAAAFLTWAMAVVRQTTRGLYIWAQDQAAMAARAEADADRARLAALQAQMQPHFLFNALNTIASLTATDPARAERVVLMLSSLLRHSLQRDGRAQTTVADEVAFAREYLGLEHERVGDRLAVRFDIDETARHLRIPSMSLQPLLENVVKHVVQARREPTSVVVSARVEGNELHVTVRDDGEGMRPGASPGIGLTNLRQRLERLNGGRSRLDVTSTSQGTSVIIVVPATV